MFKFIKNVFAVVIAFLGLNANINPCVPMSN